MKKLNIIVLVTLITFTITNSNQTVFGQTKTLLKSSRSCNKLKNQINNLFSKANYCITDTDCILSENSSCLFGCNSLVNKNVNTSKIKKEIEKYSSKACAVCNIDCISPPQQENIKCSNGKCIDNRL